MTDLREEPVEAMAPDFMSLIEEISFGEGGADYVVPPQTNKEISPMLAKRGVKLRVRDDCDGTATVLCGNGSVMQSSLPVTADELRAFAVVCLKVARAMEHGHE